MDFVVFHDGYQYLEYIKYIQNICLINYFVLNLIKLFCID